MTTPARRSPAEVAQDNLDALGARYAKANERVARAEHELARARTARADLASLVEYAAANPLLKKPVAMNEDDMPQQAGGSA